MAETCSLSGTAVEAGAEKFASPFQLSDATRK
jgi:hypothetical protein